MDELREHSLADAQFVKLEADAEKLRVLIRDWRERMFWICFEDVLAFQATNLNSSDLSHATEDASDPFLSASAATAGEDAAQYRCISIIEVDTEQAMLKVVARSFVIKDET